ncbi:transporter, NhaC family [Shewanella psychrophila]|uniref:Transporter, NhaC family n=1 Tax=Shewanella psychrophila TaxID=225848 RepID=A0A1S6HU31_9GAMM|nr:Na+/H+ antiporter NhaC family protein [Shewanella psychrophila]AQS39053.1 transporter, NhaC family [Shewanella psychrophila]
MPNDNAMPLPSSNKLSKKIGYLLGFATLVILFIYIGQNHVQGESFGWLSILPTCVVLGIAFTTHRSAEPLVIGTVAGLIMLNPGETVPGIVKVTQAVLVDPTIAWIILVCGLMGGLIALLETGGSIFNFSRVLLNKVKSKEQTMLITFCLGILIFIDDYLNALAISTSMKLLTDKYKISREKLAYLVDSTAAPVCILVPFSTWAVFFGSLLESNGIAESGQGLAIYIDAIPYMAYGWATLAVVFLVAIRKLPDLGPMKAAELRAQAGQPKPDGVDEIDLELVQDKQTSDLMGVINFLLPMIVLVIASWLYGIDLLAGVIVAITFTIALYWLQNILSITKMFDSMFKGFKVMLVPLATVIGGFMLKNVNDQLGLTQHVIDTIVPHISPAIFPAVIFLVLTAMVFATASIWGLFAVAMPIVFPVAIAIGTPMPIIIGALLSAAAAGSHSCFFSDSTVLSAQGSGCTPIQHARTQLPYTLIGIAITAIFFLIIA